MEVRKPPPSSPTLVLFECPECGWGQLARVLIWDEDGQPAMVCCLGCEAFIPAEDVVWCVGEPLRRRIEAGDWPA
jgi:hypothetical protein